MAITDKVSEPIQTQSEITLTDRAASELKTLIVENGKESALLRVWVQGGGCSGLSYGMALDDSEPEEGDQIFSHSDVRIVVDSMSIKYMSGSIVDYVDDVLGGGFKIENPKAVKSCGCGSSFATGEEGIDGLETGGKSCGGCGCH